MDLRPLLTGVVDHDGKPMRGISVAFWPAGASTTRNHPSDDDGRFRIEVAPGGSGRLTANLADNPFRQVTEENIAAGAEGIVLRLPKP